MYHLHLLRWRDRSARAPAIEPGPHTSDSPSLLKRSWAEQGYVTAGFFADEKAWKAEDPIAHCYDKKQLQSPVYETLLCLSVHVAPRLSVWISRNKCTGETDRQVDKQEHTCRQAGTQWRTEGAEGASSPWRHFRRGGTSGKMLKFTLQMVKFTLKNVIFSINELKIIGRHRWIEDDRGGGTIRQT